MPRKQCKACDVFFVAFRSDALTCSPRCRQRYKRQCDKITAEMAAKKLPGGKNATASGWREPHKCPQCGEDHEAMPELCIVCRMENDPLRLTGSR